MSWLISKALMEAYANSRCSQELAAESSEENYSGGARSALSSGSPTPQAFLPSDKMTAFSRPSQFGMTFAHLTDGLGAELLTWFLEDSRARTSALPEKVTASMESAAAYGLKWRGSLARYSHDSRSWKTAQHSFLAGSDEFSETWPRWGTTLDGVLYLLPTPVLSTSENESGLWQTPVADDAIERKDGKWNSRGEPKLSAEVKLWPTPTASLGTKGGRVTPRKGREGGTLIEAVSARKKWPTPLANDAMKRGAARVGAGLPGAVEQSNDSGLLNPTWVEWLMGWWLGWTDLKPLETGKFHSAQPLRGESLPEQRDA